MSEGNKPAFARPYSKETADNGLLYAEHESSSGLTKREYFAGLAMQGWLSSLPDECTFDEKSIAEQVVKIADALLAALATPKEGDSDG